MTGLLITTSALVAQNKFAKQINLEACNEYWAGSLVQSTDGSYVITRPFNSAGVTDWLVFNMGVDGTPGWATVFGDAQTDHSHAIAKAADNGFVITGEAQSYPQNLFVLKLSSNGGYEWLKTFGGAGYNQGHSIILTTDGGFAVAGFTSSSGAGGYDFLVLKLTSDGSLTWAKTYGGTNDDIAHSIIQTADGGFLVTGWTKSFYLGGSSNLFVLKLAADGSLSWAKIVWGINDEEPGTPSSIIQSPDGGFIIVGYTRSAGVGGSDAFVVKLASDGSLLWAKTIGGVGDDRANAVVQTPDGGVVFAGATSSFGSGGADFFIVKMDANGTLLWAKTFGDVSDNAAVSLIRAQDGDLAIMGISDVNFVLLKLDSNGDYPGGGCVMPCSPSVNNWVPSIYTVSVGQDYTPPMGNPVPTMSTPSLVSSDLCTPLEKQETEMPRAMITCSPVPGGIIFKSQEEMCIRLYSADGQLVLRDNLKEGQTRINLDPGVYLWQAGAYKGKAVVR
jgi:uncharacterized delta-60 repeat protein